MKVVATGKTHGFKKRISKKDGVLRELQLEQWTEFVEMVERWGFEQGRSLSYGRRWILYVFESDRRRREDVQEGSHGRP